MSDSTRLGRARGKMLPVAFVTAALAAMLAIAPLASAASDPISSGTTTLTINSGFSKKAKKAGITIAAVKPSKLKGYKATFAVTGGEIEPTTGAGTVTHSGGLKITWGKKSVTLKSLTIDTKGKSISAKVGGKTLKFASLAGTSTALFGVATVDLWHWWGFLCVIFFAALRQVPQEHIEAARLEGATYFQMLRYVLLPGIRPTIILMMILTIIWSFLAFDFVYILTQGGPAFSSEVLSTLAYRHAFYDLNVGQAAAVALIISCFGLVATFFYIRVQTREEQL